MSSIADVMHGEKLLRNDKLRSDAMGVLTKRQSALNNWHYLLLILSGTVFGGGLVFLNQQDNWLLLLGSLAGAGCFTGVSAVLECIRLRRRLDAVVTLLQLNGKL